MGAFLSEPVTTKESEDGEAKLLKYGASAMQGWRISMEDAHNCLPDIGESTSMFAVYDGHGGSEVAEYCAKYLSKYISDQDSFKNEDLENCLHDAFLSIDKKIASEEGISELKTIAGESKEDDEGDEDEAALLEEEATIPIEQLLKRLEQNVKEKTSKSASKSDIKADTNNDEPQENGDCKSPPSSHDVKRSEADKEQKEEKNMMNGNASHEKDNDEEAPTTSGSSDGKPKGGSNPEAFKDDEDDDDESDEEDTEDFEDDDDDEDDAEEEDDVIIPQSDECGMESGTTANVALIRGSKLFVANVGDSRCVLSRAGKAVDMSVDHKPEDETEKQRILLAGGKVSADGRVNGGLNLSRALGDHAYKQEENLAPEQQAISPQPDIKEIELTSEDQFLVLACDGIWNVKESQDVIDFVQARLDARQESGDKQLSGICEELLDACVAPDSSGDGSGCDNMTCIIITFDKSCATTNTKKREREETEGTNKKARTDD